MVAAAGGAHRGSGGHWVRSGTGVRLAELSHIAEHLRMAGVQSVQRAFAILRRLSGGRGRGVGGRRPGRPAEEHGVPAAVDDVRAWRRRTEWQRVLRRRPGRRDRRRRRARWRSDHHRPADPRRASSASRRARRPGCRCSTAATCCTLDQVDVDSPVQVRDDGRAHSGPRRAVGAGRPRSCSVTAYLAGPLDDVGACIYHVPTACRAGGSRPSPCWMEWAIEEYLEQKDQLRRRG